jgi:hypothetical protein
MVCSRCEACVHVLATGGMPGSVGRFMSLFPTLTEYFMYSPFSYFLYIAAMLCCSEDEEFFDEDFF